MTEEVLRQEPDKRMLGAERLADEAAAQFEAPLRRDTLYRVRIPEGFERLLEVRTPEAARETVYESFVRIYRRTDGRGEALGYYDRNTLVRFGSEVYPAALERAPEETKAALAALEAQKARLRMTPQEVVGVLGLEWEKLAGEEREAWENRVSERVTREGVNLAFEIKAAEADHKAAEERRDKLLPEVIPLSLEMEALIESFNALAADLEQNWDVSNVAAEIKRKTALVLASYLKSTFNLPGIDEKRSRLLTKLSRGPEGQMVVEREIGRVGEKANEALEWMVLIGAANGAAPIAEIEDWYMEQFGGVRVEGMLAGDVLSGEKKAKLKKLVRPTGRKRERAFVRIDERGEKTVVVEELGEMRPIVHNVMAGDEYETEAAIYKQVVMSQVAAQGFGGKDVPKKMARLEDELAYYLAMGYVRFSDLDARLGLGTKEKRKEKGKEKRTVDIGIGPTVSEAERLIYPNAKLVNDGGPFGKEYATVSPERPANVLKQWGYKHYEGNVWVRDGSNVDAQRKAAPRYVIGLVPPLLLSMPEGYGFKVKVKGKEEAVKISCWDAFWHAGIKMGEMPWGFGSGNPDISLSRDLGLFLGFASMDPGRLAEIQRDLPTEAGARREEFLTKVGETEETQAFLRVIDAGLPTEHFKERVAAYLVRHREGFEDCQKEDIEEVTEGVPKWVHIKHLVQRMYGENARQAILLLEERMPRNWDEIDSQYLENIGQIVAVMGKTKEHTRTVVQVALYSILKMTSPMGFSGERAGPMKDSQLGRKPPDRLRLEKILGIGYPKWHWGAIQKGLVTKEMAENLSKAARAEENDPSEVAELLGIDLNTRLLILKKSDEEK